MESLQERIAALFPANDAGLVSLTPRSERGGATREIPVLFSVTPYRLEHPHCALVRKHTSLTRQDILYTPIGRLTRSYSRAAEDAVLVAEGAFVRRGTQLPTLLAYWEDVQVVPLPESFFASPEGVSLCSLLPTPYARLAREWMEPRLAPAFCRETAGQKCLKVMEALYAREVEALAPYHPQAILLEEGLTRELATQPAYARSLAAALKLLRARFPEALLAATVDGHTPPEADALPDTDLILYTWPPLTDESLARTAEEMGQRLADRPAHSRLVLPAGEGEALSALLEQLGDAPV